MRRFLVVLFVVATMSLAGFGWLFIVNNVRDDMRPTKVSNQPAKPKQASFADRQLAKMSLRQKVASLLILHTSGTDAEVLKAYLQKYQLGGLIFMSDNLPPLTEDLSNITSLLQATSVLPYLFAIDEEGGIVTRLVTDTLPSAIDLKSEPSAATRTAFYQRSVLLKQTGMNLNFGIVADVTDDPSSFIYSRVFGGDATAVSERVVAAVEGSDGLTLSTLKHYPGHGETESDSHTSIPTVDVSLETWEQQDEPPFKAGIKAGADFVMFGHLIYSSVDSAPASLSVKWHDMLKTQDEFNGVSITDDMRMLQDSGDPAYLDPIANAINALVAGNTMLLFVSDGDQVSTEVSVDNLIDGIVVAVSDGRISQSVIDSNVRKVLGLRHGLSMTIDAD